jgi:acetolactate synthase-1/2/3 large subunit
LKEIAERWSIPVATTLRAKGVFPQDHVLSLDVFGYAGTRHATSAILGGELDCLLVLGSGFNERDTMHWTARIEGIHELGFIGGSKIYDFGST